MVDPRLPIREVAMALATLVEAEPPIITVAQARQILRSVGFLPEQEVSPLEKYGEWKDRTFRLADSFLHFSKKVSKYGFAQEEAGWRYELCLSLASEFMAMIEAEDGVSNDAPPDGNVQS